MHLPVLKKELLEILDPKPNENFIDCTFGEGGHSLSILEKNFPSGKVLGIEIDPFLYQKGKKLEEKFKGRLILVNDSFGNIKEIVKRTNFPLVKGIIFDLGVCTFHFEESKRGFTFLRDEPLFMRYDNNPQGVTARDIVNNFSKKELEKILREYAQEKWAEKIAKAIVEARKKKKIERTLELVEIIKRAIPSRHKGKIHFATKTFLALRIAVNEEIENLKKGLEGAFQILTEGGKLAVISFHSTEDRIVKNFFRNLYQERKCLLLTKKPIFPSKEEIFVNPKSRSARLRVIQKIKN